MKKLDYIENIFKERFDPSAVKNEGWNDPSDLVWEKIEDDLYKEDKHMFGYLPFLLLSLLFMTLILTGYLFYQNQELKKDIQEAVISNSDIISNKNIEERQQKSIRATELLTEKLEVATPSFENANSNETSEERQHKSLRAIQLSTDIVEPTTSSFENVVSNIDISKSTAARRNDGRVEAYIAPISLDKVSTQKDVKENRTGLPSFLTEEPATMDDEYSGILITENVEDRNIDVSKLPIKFLPLEASKHVFPARRIKIEKDDQSRRSYLSILPNVAVGFLKTTGNQETALSELIDKEYGNTGYGVDLTITSSLSDRVDFSYGLGVESMNFSTEYDITLPYNAEDEVISGENGFIDFEHSLPTAFGNTETALRLSRLRSSSALEEPDVLLDFDTRHRFVSLSLPLALSYRLGSGKSFFKVGASLRPSYIFYAQSAIQYVKSHHSEVDAVNNVSVSTYTDIRKLNASFGIDVGYHFHVFQKSGFNINVGFQDYLFDIYEVNSFSSSVQKIGLSVGYFYQI